MRAAARRLLGGLLGTIAYGASLWLTRAIVSCLARWEVVGADRLPAEGGLILVANHVHLLDPPLVAASMARRVHPMAKRELFAAPLVRWFFTAYGAFPVRRFAADLGALRVARNYLRDGEVVLMFPEGTRGRGAQRTQLRPALPGAAMVALMSHAPVVPVAITGSNVAIPGVFWAWALGRRPRIRVEFGTPEVIAEARADARTAEAVTDRMMRRVAALLPEANRGVYGAATEGPIVVQRAPRAPDAPDGAPDAPEGVPPEG